MNLPSIWPTLVVPWDEIVGYHVPDPQHADAFSPVCLCPLACAIQMQEFLLYKGIVNRAKNAPAQKQNRILEEAVPVPDQLVTVVVGERQD